MLQRIVNTADTTPAEFAMPSRPGLTTPADPAHAVGANDADHRWTAIRLRDRNFDGEFVYAVRTTGVYCRPSCPSRTARPENIAFFDTTHLARAAGYRPCRRCTPDESSLEHRHNDMVTAACRAIEGSPTSLSLANLAGSVGLSPHHFHRVFKRVTGVTPKGYFKAVQARRMKDSLPTATNVTQAIYDAGFSSSGRFYERAAADLGMTPTTYRSGGSSLRIRYAIEPCALGFILVAATKRGVCGIEFGDSPHHLIAHLCERMPNAEFDPGDAEFRTWVATVLAYIEHPSGSIDLPLDIRGTIFQRRVWQALRDIPSATSTTYAKLAASIGQPGAARAVAHACASNPVAVAVPCHRVVRSNGQLSGYRWGSERKAELLRREAANKAPSGTPDPI